MKSPNHQNRITSLSSPIYTLGLLFLVLIPINAHAQQYFIKSYSVDNGLPTRIISDACQDKEGYMWFSTYMGISKYDGFNFINYDTINKLPEQHYRRIKCDEKGIIWSVPFTNNQKLVFFNNNTWKTIAPPSQKKPENYITSFDILYINNSPVICVGSYGGVDIYMNNNWKHYTISNEEAKNKVYSVTAHKGLFYLGTGAGLCILNGSTMDWSLNSQINAKNEAIQTVCFEKANMSNEKMWILTSHSLAYYSYNKLTTVADKFVLEEIDITNFPYIAIRKSGDIIFGSNFSKYLLKTEDNAIIPLKVKNGFSSNGASSVFIDREENIWFTDSRGIDKISDITLVNYFESGGMPENEVSAITETADGKIMLGHNNQISELYDTYFKVTEFPGLKNSVTRVLDMMRDRDGNIWFCANNLGIGKLNIKGTIRWYKFEKGFLTTAICQDLSGRIWIGTNRKLFYLKNDKIVEFEHNDELTSGIRKIYPSDKGGIYITSMNGLWYIDVKNSRRISVSDESQQFNVFSYYKDIRGTEFVGTMNGLFFIKKGVITRFENKNLKITSPVYFILQDEENYYWFGTNNGVIRWDGNSEPEVLNTLNGLAGRETNRSAGFLDSKGQVWVGTDKGLSCFTLGKDRSHTPAPEVKLLYVETMHGNRYLLNETSTINFSDNTLTFHFRGISFVNEELLTYKYKLEGYDHDWREASQSMLDKINYIDVKPGKYKFCVIAKNYSGSWSQIVYSKEIKILYPFYFSWWFILLSLLIIIAILRGLYQFKTQKLINKTFIKEIQERKLAEDNLKESEQRLSFILEGSRLGTWDWDIKTNIIKRNHLWAEMLGFDNSEIDQSPLQWNKLIHPEDKERAWNDVQNHLEGKTKLLESEYRLLTKDKKYKWIHDRAMVVQRDSTGKAQRMSGTHTDITDRKLAEEALQKSEETLRLLLESLPVAIYISPVNTEIDLEMITGNVKSLTGFTEEEFLSAPDFWRTRLHPDDRERVLNDFKLAPANGGLITEYRWLMANGEYKWVHDQNIIKKRGSKQEFLGVFVDINNLKLAEQEIKDKNEQLYLTNAEKDKLFSIISHDLRSPVNGFLGLTALLTEESEHLDKAQLKEVASALYHSASKVNDLLNDLLEWSRLQRGLIKFEPSTLKLKQIADACINIMLEQSHAKNIVVINQIPEEVEVAADLHMIEVVFRNLLTNALKFTPKGGKVTLSADFGNDSFAKITVTDTGIGITPELLNKLFKVDEKTSRKGTEGEPSSGLGLILCREFVEKQNGKIWAESIENEGSSFHFTVPNKI